MTSYVITLIGNARTTPLSTSTVKLISQSLDIETRENWLAKDEACDLFFESHKCVSALRAQTNEAMQGAGIDAVCMPVATRRKKILISDMDSTIIDQECIDELGDAIGVGKQISQITQAVVNGEIGFSDALRQRMTLMKGMDYQLLERVYKERITVKDGARTLVQTMRKHGAYCILVSGGFSFFTSRIAKRIGFHDHQANELEFKDNKLTGGVIEPILGRTAKLETMIKLCADNGLSSDNVVAVGDGANDIKMIDAAGLGVAFHGSNSLKERANAHINHADLTSLLYIQGYQKSEFLLS
jgi:phosphoserine phosphatase